MSKFTPDQHRPRSKKSGAGSAGAGGRDLSTLQAAMMASECKVADWLAHNDPTVVRSESTEDDSKSIKSDVPVHLKRLKGEGVSSQCFFVATRAVGLLQLHYKGFISASPALSVYGEIDRTSVGRALCCCSLVMG